MRFSTGWPSLIISLRKEQLISLRALCREAGINRSRLRNFLRGTGGMRIEQLESILSVLGYDLDAVPKSDIGRAS